MLPGPDAYIAGQLGLRSTVRRLPIQQLGCAAGGTALAQAHDFLRAHPHRLEDGRPTNVLVIAVELCSLSYQPEETSISDFISAGLFGDGAAAAVVRGDDAAPGVRLVANHQHLVPDSTQVIAGTTSERGFHFATNPRVRATVPRVIPVVERFLGQHGVKPDGLDLRAERLDLSWQSLREVGNVSSVVVFDVLRRTFDQRRPPEGATGLILAFGPGFTTEMLLCTWNEP